MHRAIVVFVENKSNLLSELNILHTSLDHICCLDTDLVVFGPRAALNKVPNSCIKIECMVPSNDPKWKKYHFINSIACINDKSYSYLDKYTHILRCDADTLVTPAWHNFQPDTYTTGKGGYVNDDYTREKLISIANHLGLRHQGIFNIGSTHYGTSKHVKEVCMLTAEIAEYILKTEFLQDEGKWPGWFRGVILLYASDLAVNHLVTNPNMSHNLLDFDSTSSDLIASHPHIHCWHTQSKFSKFSFHKGAYNHINKNSLNTDIVHDYCLYMALKSIGK